MKTKIIIFLFGLIIANLGFAQNRDCESLELLCSDQLITFEYNDAMNPDVACTSPAQPFYYGLNFINSGENVNLNGSSSSGTYVYYGPFSFEILNSCELISMNAAPYVTGQYGNGNTIDLSNEIGFYVLELIPDDCHGSINFRANTENTQCEEALGCDDCVTSFNPSPGQYLVSTWVKEDNSSPYVTSYTSTGINIGFGSGTVETLTPSGLIIDGWQRIEELIDIPVGSTQIDIELFSTGPRAFFDDIRFFPYDGSMMSYVYDPGSLRLLAELDERNYATLYEYDEEGKLIRVKKETERGIMTIQENRDNIKKQ